MASIEPRNGVFRIVFRFDGRRYSRTLSTCDPAVAASIKTTVEQRIKLIKTGMLPAPHKEHDVLEYLISGNSKPNGRNGRPKPENGKQNFGGLCDDYLHAFLRSSVEDLSFKTIEIHIGHLKRIIGPTSSLVSFGRSSVQRYIAERSKEPGIRGSTVSPVTIRKEVTTLKGIATWALENGYIESVFQTKGLRYPKGKEKPPFQTVAEVRRKIERDNLSDADIADLWDCVFLSTDEISQLLKLVKKRARHEFIYPMFCFAAHTGARRSEMMRAQVDDIDLQQSRILIREKKRVRGKTSTRSVPMSGFLKRTLKAWLKVHPGGSNLFCIGERLPRSNKKRTQNPPLTRDEAHDHFQTTLLGTEWEAIRGWHCLRHSFCSNCAAAGVEQRVINSWVGHQTEEMVRRYRHLFPNREAEAIESVFSGA